MFLFHKSWLAAAVAVFLVGKQWITVRASDIWGPSTEQFWILQAPWYQTQPLKFTTRSVDLIAQRRPTRNGNFSFPMFLTTLTT